MFNFPAQSYNEVMLAMRRSRPLRGMRTRIVESPSGVLIAPDMPPPDWNHPWKIHPSWLEEEQKDGSVKKNWIVTVTPGFVNGADVVLTKTEAPLTSDPAPKLDVIGFRDATGMNGHYPAKFKRLGARKPEEPDPELTAILGGASSVTVPLFSEKYGTRRLMAADIILHVDHGGTRTDTTFADPTTGRLVINSVAFTPQMKRYPYRVAAVSLFTPPLYPSLQDRLQNQADEPNYDEIQLATLWLLSPPDVTDEAMPDQTWQPFTQHFVFWNVGYAGVNKIAFNDPTPMTIVTGLAFGLADPLMNAMLAPINDETQTVMDALNATSTQGYFWTL